MPLDEAFADVYLESRLDWDAEPALSAEEKQVLQQSAKAVDANGNSPDHDDYEPTFTYNSMNLAILEGWKMKLGKAAETVSEDGENLVFEHCKQMVTFWTGQVVVTDPNGPQGSNYSQAIRTSAYW